MDRVCLAALAVSLLLCAGCGETVRSDGSPADVSPPAITEPDSGEPTANVTTASLEGILSFPGAAVTVEDSTSLGDLTLDRTRYTLYEGTDGIPAVIDLDLQYPQISGLVDEDVETAINLTFLNIVFQVFGDNMTLSTMEGAFLEAQENADQRPCSTDLVGEMDYQIVGYFPPYLSVHFTGYSVVTRANDVEYFVTINTETAAFLSLTSAVDMDDLKTAILRGNYEVLSGRYAPGGWDGPEMAEPFWKSFENYLERDRHSKCSNPGGNGQSTSSLTVQGKPCTYNEFDSLSSENFAFDEDGIYIQFSFSDSLMGYVALKIPRSQLTERSHLS